jgi:hypothetical protein
MTAPKAEPGVRLEHYGTPTCTNAVEQIRTFAQLRRRLQELQDIGSKDRFFITAYLYKGGRRCLGVVLADTGWLLMYHNPQHHMMKFSLGNRRARGEIEFLSSEWESMSKRYLIPADDALEAVQEWFSKGQLSKAIEWEQNPYQREGEALGVAIATSGWWAPVGRQPAC